MKNTLFYLAMLLFVNGASAQISESDCDVLQDLYENRTTSLNNWTYTNGSVTRDMTKYHATSNPMGCDCSDPNTRPKISDMTITGQEWTGVHLDPITESFIYELKLTNLIKNGNSLELLKTHSPTALADLERLTLGNTSPTSTTTEAPPVFEDGALPGLERLTWSNEQWDKLPDLPALTSSASTSKLHSLKRIVYSGIAIHSGTYAGSNLDEFEQRDELIKIGLYNLTFNGNKIAFPDIFGGSEETLEIIEIKGTFNAAASSSTSGTWYPDAMVHSSREYKALTTLRVYDNSFSGMTIDNNNALFNTTTLPEIKNIWLYNNGLTGTVPANLLTIFDPISPATSDDNLIRIENNSLSGELIPDLQGVTSNVYHYVARNNLFTNPKDSRSGMFDDMDNLVRLDIASCGFKCNLSTLEISTLSRLETLKIDGNGFTGAVPSYYGTAFSFLSEFYCDHNLLTEMPVLPSTLNVLRMNNNYFNMDDIYNAANASAHQLALNDGATTFGGQANVSINEGNFIIGPQYSRRGDEIRTINMAGESYYATDAGIELVSVAYAGTSNNILRNWQHVELDPDNNNEPISATINPVSGGNGATTYNLSASNDLVAANNGRMWYCEISIPEPDFDPDINNVVNPNGFYSEFSIIGARTVVSFNTAQVCSLSSPPDAGSINGLFIIQNQQNQASNTNQNTALAQEVAQSGASSIIDPEAEGLFEVYPNPAYNTVTIESNDKIELVRLYDLNGNLVKELASGDTSLSFSLSNLEQGSYLMQVKTDNGWNAARVIKAY